MRTITGEGTNILRRPAMYKKENQQEGPEYHKKMLKESDSPVIRVLRSPFHAVVYS
ncbi:hypothetical protein C0J52_10637 [Blattella germanica]|nr:hypothetical protein C0J52_10637 [Blattella germanica]